MKEDKRAIDRQRDSAVQMRVGAADDASAITEMFPIGGVLHVIKGDGIYACKLADDIDPQRTNPNIPNVQQRVLQCGSNSELVGKTLLTAHKLFNPHFLPTSFDKDAAISIVFEMLKDLAVMHETASALNAAEQKTQIEDRRGEDRSVVLPAIGDVPARCKTFLQKADHALQSLFGIAKIFYGEALGKRWFESLMLLAKDRYGADDQFTKFMEEVLPFLQFIRNARNAVEHPKNDERIVVSDFTLNHEMKIFPPSIELIHPETPQPTIAASNFMALVNEQITGIVELMIAFICSRNVQPFAGFQFHVVELPVTQRANRYVRYSYGTYNGDQIIPAG